MNILKQELKQNKYSVIIWAISILALVFIYSSVFSSVSGDITEIINSFPDAFKKGFGISENGFSTLPALYSMLLGLVLLVGSVQAMNLGVGIISKEVRYKTADFLLTKPVSRLGILFQKVLSGVLLLIITNVIFFSGTWLFLNFFLDDVFTFGTYISVSLTLFLIQSFFFALGFFFGSVLPKVKSVIAITLPTVFGFYVFGMLDTVIGEKIKYLTPFKFFDLEGLGSGDNYEAGILVYLGVLVAIFIISSFYNYRKKDIHTV